MTHISLDDQPAAVRDVFLNLPVAVGGSVVELAGRPVARVIPAATPVVGSNPPTWIPEQNRRRCELIDRKYGQGLTPAEDAELADLQAALHHFLDAVAPLPIEATRKLHQELLQKASHAGTGA